MFPLVHNNIHIFYTLESSLNREYMKVNVVFECHWYLIVDMLISPATVNLAEV